MIRVLYFPGAQGSAENFSGHAGVQVVDHKGDEVIYITWASAGSIPARRCKWLKVKWMRQTVQPAYGATVDSRQEDEGYYSNPPKVVEIPALTETQAGLDEDALLHWWRGFSLDLGDSDDKTEERSEYYLLTKNCTTICAMALLAAGMHHYVTMGVGTGMIGNLAPQKLRSTAFTALWRPKMLYDAALAARAKINEINQNHQKLQSVLGREFTHAQHSGRFMNAAGGKERGLWTVEAWKKASAGSTRFSHRYEALKRIDRALAAYHATRDDAPIHLHEIGVALHAQLAARPTSNRKPAVLALASQVYERLKELKVAGVEVNKGNAEVLERSYGKLRAKLRQKAEALLDEARLSLEAAETAFAQQEEILARLGPRNEELRDDIIWEQRNIAELLEKMVHNFDKLGLSPDAERVYQSIEGYRQAIAEGLKRFMTMSAQAIELDRRTGGTRQRSNAMANVAPNLGNARGGGARSNPRHESFPEEDDWEEIAL